MTEVLNETDYQIDCEEFVRLADFVLSAMHVSMSFPMDELRPGTADHPTESGTLGDICICPQVAEQQARQAGHSSVEEMLFLATHGMLHLLGYDHAEPAEKEEMFTLQRQLLLSFLAQR